ncbi:MAG: hemerythrin domain-containing protein [bacterium]
MPLKKSDIASQIEKEHECIKRDMVDIKMDVMKEVSPKNFPDWRLEFIWRLRDFKTHLLKHFDLEEEGGFMNEILSEAPEAMNQVKKLEAEHGQIVSDLDRILSDLKEMQEKDISKLDGIRNCVIQLISTIRAHETAEDNLIQTVYYQEYGYPASS